ncbi:MAG: ferredoxin [Methylorubrum populi]
MKVVVDLNRCQAYAQCIYAAPGHFALHGREALVYDPSPDEAARGAIERAVQACPVRAITAFPDAPEQAGEAS